MVKRVVSSLVGLGIFLVACFSGLLPWVFAVTIVAGLCVAEFVAANRRARALKPQEYEPHFLNLGGNGDATHAPDKRAPEAENHAPREDWVNPVLAWAGVLCPFFTYAALVTDMMARLSAWSAWPGILLLVAVVGIFAVRVARAEQHGRALSHFRPFYGLAGFAYIGMLFSSFVLIRGLPGRIVVTPFGEADRGAWLMLFVAFCVWATDTFAFFAGRAFGKRKLAPNLSPGKTVEGALCGLTGAMTVGMAFGTWIHLPLLCGLTVGVIAGVAGQLGDLFESALKRELGVKDFGSVMPGHGGALDRFDSMLFVAPLAYLYLRLFTS